MSGTACNLERSAAFVRQFLTGGPTGWKFLQTRSVLNVRERDSNLPGKFPTERRGPRGTFSAACRNHSLWRSWNPSLGPEGKLSRTCQTTLIRVHSEKLQSPDLYVKTGAPVCRADKGKKVVQTQPKWRGVSYRREEPVLLCIVSTIRPSHEMYRYQVYCDRWRNVTKYSYSRSVLNFDFPFCISIFCYFKLCSTTCIWQLQHCVQTSDQLVKYEVLRQVKPTFTKFSLHTNPSVIITHQHHILHNGCFTFWYWSTFSWWSLCVFSKVCLWWSTFPLSLLLK